MILHLQPPNKVEFEQKANEKKAHGILTHRMNEQFNLKALCWKDSLNKIVSIVSAHFLWREPF
jgi:hypothetical protein